MNVAFVDYTKVEAIDHMKTLARINFFVSNSVSFLNHFSAVCEKKLVAVHERLQKIEASLALLESKLTHIPGLEGVVGEQYVSTTVISDAAIQAARASAPPTATAASSTPAAATPAVPTSTQGGSAPPPPPPPGSGVPPPPPPPGSGVPPPPPPPGMSGPPCHNADSPPPPPGGDAPPPPPPAPVATVRNDPRFIPFFKMQAVGVPDGAVRMKMQQAGLDSNYLDTPDAPAPPVGAAGPQRGAIPLMSNHTGEASSAPPSTRASDESDQDVSSDSDD